MKLLRFGLLCLWAAAARASESPSKSAVRFNRDIKPILAENCYACHGADSSARKAKLRLDREEGFFDKREDGPTVVKGKPEDSPLYKRISSTDPDEVMPPPKSKHQLTLEQKNLIKTWIAQGAVWQPHWSFIKPERPEPPKVANEKWVRSPIDRFVLAKLEEKGLTPAPEADKRTLARRLSLDLTGLPPAPEAVDAFLADASPDAYEKLVDKLMATPQYGEHRARYWLDAARYADTHGIHFDNFRDVWPYRDWVINALNKNEPFDKFTVDQLAGDLLPDATREQIIATGFQRCNITTNEGGSINDEVLCNYARDRVETTSWVWLGLTANCCACHDHKFDPITQKDFYSMSAFYRNTTQAAMDGNIRDTAPVLIMPKAEDKGRWDAIPGEIDAANKAIAERKKVQRVEFDKWLEHAKPEELAATIDKIGAPVFHLPLNEDQWWNEERPANEATGTFDGKPVTGKAKEALIWKETGKLGKAPVFDGNKAPLELPGDVGNREKDQPYSFGAWVKMPQGFNGTGAIFSRMEDPPGYRGWDFWVQGTEFGTHFISKWPDDGVKVVTTGKQVKPGTWQHVFVTYDGSMKATGFKLYVDGKEAKLKVENDKLKSSTKTPTPFLVSRRKDGSALTNVAIQDIRLYSRKLAPQEIYAMAFQPRMQAVLAKNAKDRSAKEKDELFEVFASGDEEILKLSEKTATLEAEKKTLRERSPVAYVMEEKKGSMPTANILYRGDYSKPKDKVEPTVFAALHPLPANAPKNRLGLAQWIVSPENPLTCRVMVNRYWQEIFGTGLVKTSEDFGVMGEAPSHEHLLDWLAVEFRDGGWDQKKMFKELVMSAAYRQAAVATKEKLEKDAANRLLSRGPRFRMDAEMIRDYALAASGLLVPKIGGPSVKPYQPEGIWEVVGMPESNTRYYKRDSGESLYRRSLYTFWKRAAPPASMDIFNATSRETCTIRRERTDTPLQALVTLNDPQFVEAARVLAEKAIKSGSDENGRLDFIARRVLCRTFNEKERTIVKKAGQQLIESYKSKPEDAKKLITVGDMKADAAVDPAELAAWTMVCNEVFNLDEVLNK
jgi:hypothetical protein